MSKTLESIIEEIILDFHNIYENKVAGKYGVDQGNQLLFSNNTYYDTKWEAYFCNTEVVFAFESYHFSKRNHNNDIHSPLLSYGGCPREVETTQQQKIDVNGNLLFEDENGTEVTDETDKPAMETVPYIGENGKPVLITNENPDAHLMPIKRYNSHYYFEEIEAPNELRVSPYSFTTFNGQLYTHYYYVNPTTSELGDLTNPEDLIQGDYNIYSFTVPLDLYTWGDRCGSGNNSYTCLVEPYYWINGGGYTYDIGAVFLDFEPLLTTYWSALEVYQSFKQGEYSDIVGDENNGCAEPMLDARDKNPNRTSLPDFDRLDNPICHHLKISGSQTPLFDEGFGYGLSPNGIIFDNYGLFRRDFYGNTRYDGTDISSGAIQ